MDWAIDTPLFGVTISIITYFLARFISQRLRMPILNPLLLAIAAIIFILKTFNIDLETYNLGGNIITFFLAPATIALAVPLYKQWDVFKNNYLIIISGVLVGVLTGVFSTIIMGKLFNFDKLLITSLIPKNTTTPIAIEIANMLGTNASLAVTFVILSGTLGYVIGEYVLKTFNINNNIAKGIALGTASHVMGTTKAMELGDIEGAMSSIAITLAGIITIILVPFVLKLI
ncbi:LrgB family protein [Soehngenia longivitae]|uniref:LrgB family protein n=1 Tax=Soehngenia longivitae TaxID=2562294 RepID=A0A4Z0D750_9FIRM|nr:LrgB family protein [Soehngenia longivitae]TFZ40714.1 LrgB family protein [Soehngenia longivitae]